jgi:hypothetical protein
MPLLQVMAIKLTKGASCVSLLLLLFLATTAFNCEGEKEPEFIMMDFVLPFTITPTDANFSLGDTLWVEAAFSEKLEEYNSKVYYDIKDFDFQSKILLFELTNPNLDLSYQPSAVDFFHFIPIVGTIPFIGETASPFAFEYKENKYFFRLGLVPKQKGVFCVNFLPPSELDLRPGLMLGKTNDGRERIPSFQHLYFLINEGNTNFDLFKQNCKANSITTPLEINIFYEQKGTFTFEVK